MQSPWGRNRLVERERGTGKRGEGGQAQQGTNMSWLNDKGTGQGRSHRQEMWV